MMRPLCIFLVLFSKICQVPAGVTQDSGAITAEVGEDVTLKCSCQTGAITFLSWYQQRLAGKPTFISNQMKYSGEATVSSAFKGRFEVSGDPQDASSSCLKISSVLPSDSAMYYCGFMEFNTIEFGEGVFLHIKNQSNVQAIVHQQESQSLQLGDFVNLSCTVSSENCGSGTSIYWFRPGRAQAVITAQECSSQMKKQTSVFTITSANHLDAGMYYCVVASGGEITFGNGTRVEITGYSTKASNTLVYCLSVAVAASLILLLIFSIIIYILAKQKCSECNGRMSRHTRSAASSPVGQDSGDVCYAALSLKKTSARHGQGGGEDSVCVYSRVKTRKERE